MTDPQPIRIKSWVPTESPALTEWELERLMTAVDEAVSEVSRLLSGVVFFYICEVQTKHV